MTEDTPRPLTDQELDEILSAADANLLEWVKSQGRQSEHMESLAKRALEHATEASTYQASARHHTARAAWHARRARLWAILSIVLALISAAFSIYAILNS